MAAVGYTLGTSNDNLCTAVACSFTYTSINRGNCHTYLVRGTVYTFFGKFPPPPPPGEYFNQCHLGEKYIKAEKKKEK